jgi:hypothetical protein
MVVAVVALATKFTALAYGAYCMAVVAVTLGLAIKSWYQCK